MSKKNDPPPERHAERDCACDKCFRPKPDDERRAAEWWQALYARMGWPPDELGYL